MNVEGFYDETVKRLEVIGLTRHGYARLPREMKTYFSYVKPQEWKDIEIFVEAGSTLAMYRYKGDTVVTNGDLWVFGIMYKDILIRQRITQDLSIYPEVIND